MIDRGVFVFIHFPFFLYTEMVKKHYKLIFTLCMLR